MNFLQTLLKGFDVIELYGIPNCDTVKKARAWLTEQSIDYQFRDFKKIHLEPTLLKIWINQLGLENIINKKGTTWRKLSDDDKQRCTEIESAIPIILSNVSMIKRPLIVDSDQAVLVGFSKETWIKYFHTI